MLLLVLARLGLSGGSADRTGAGMGDLERERTTPDLDRERSRTLSVMTPKKLRSVGDIGDLGDVGDPGWLWPVMVGK